MHKNIPVHIIKQDEELRGGMPLHLPLPNYKIIEEKEETVLGTVITFTISGEDNE